MRRKLMEGRHEGLARPSNVIEATTESTQGSHSAPFPRALPEFFIKAFSDAGDLVFDPFMGSGTTMAAAALLDRTAYGCEISPAYCDVIVRRMASLGVDAVLESSGDSFAAVAEQRGVSADAPLPPPKGLHRFAKGNPLHNMAGAKADAATVGRMLAGEKKGPFL